MNGVSTTLGNRYYMVNLEAVMDIFSAIRAAVVIVFKHAQSLLWGQCVLYGAHMGTALSVISDNVVPVPLPAPWTHLAGVFQRFICNVTSLAWSIVLLPWLIVATAGNSFVARATHLLREAPVARLVGPANNTWAFVLLDGIWLQAALSSLRFAITIVAHVFSVVTGRIFVSASGARSRKSCRWHVNPLSDDLSTDCAHSIYHYSVGVKIEQEV